MNSKKVSGAVISRLPRYYRYLGEIMEEGTEKVSSKELSERMHVTASQIRQDLNNFGGFGHQGYGYNVKNLYNEIGKILGINEKHNIIIIGAGNLAQALGNYSKFGSRGYNICALFDKNPELVGRQVGNAIVHNVDELPEYLRNFDIQIAVLCIPKTSAQDIADLLISNGIKAILNFSHLDLKVPEDVVVENVHLSEALMRLTYKAKHNGEEIEEI